MKPQLLRTLIVALSALGPATGVMAQAQDEDPHAACTSMGWVPPEILQRQVSLRDGTGNALDIATSPSSDAQALYRQGLNYLHGYVWIEAARSFNQALRLDPDMAMAYWGLSRVYSGLDDHEAAVQAAKRAQTLAARATPREQRRIALRLQQLEAIADLGNAGLHVAYKQAIDKALAVDYDDVELWLIRGNAEEPSAAGRGQRGAAASTAFYMQALRLAPDNAAGHHYLIHSYEGINQIDRALVHGEAYARLAPTIPHAHHMWGHDLRRVGRIDEAIAAFRRTDDLENTYYKQERIPSDLDWHHIHNLDLLATSYEHKGQMKTAESLLRQAAGFKALNQYQEFNQKSLAVFLLGRQRWRDALKATTKLTSGESAAVRVVGHSLAGHAYLALRQLEPAQTALAAAQRELESVPALTAGILVNRGAVVPYVDALRAEMLLREGKSEEGETLLKDVQARLRALPGPDAWTQALFRLEAFARTARDVGNWKLAEHTAWQMIEHDGAYGGSHLALALAARQRGDIDLARTEAAAARKYWSDADRGMRELTEVRDIEFSGPGPVQARNEPVGTRGR
jgi:tetratricopeptide (TPR) repeat protein